MAIGFALEVWRASRSCINAAGRDRNRYSRAFDAVWTEPGLLVRSAKKEPPFHNSCVGNASTSSHVEASERLYETQDLQNHATPECRRSPAGGSRCQIHSCAHRLLAALEKRACLRRGRRAAVQGEADVTACCRADGHAGLRSVVSSGDGERQADRGGQERAGERGESGPNSARNRREDAGALRAL